MSATPSLSPGARRRAAALLLAARRECRPIPALPEGCRPGGLAEAYAIQESYLAASGATLAGFKVAATNRKVQHLLGLDGPFSGFLVRERVHQSPAELAAEDFAFRLIEPDFAFRLGADLPAREAAYDRGEAGQAVASLHPAFEVVTSAYGAAWIGLSAPALVADNAVHGAFVPSPATRSAPTSARSARSSCGSPIEAVSACRRGRKDPTRTPLICPGAHGTLWQIPGLSRSRWQC